MAVTAGQLIARGFTHRCPNCGNHTLFAGFNWLKANDVCRVCGMRFEREPGFFLGATVINYTLTTVLMLAPLLVFVFQQRIDTPTAIIAAIAWCLIFPLLFYRTSKSLWLMTYYLTFPRQLPANGGGDAPQY